MESVTVKFCSQCGNKLLTGAVFCTKCGQKIEDIKVEDDVEMDSEESSDSNGSDDAETNGDDEEVVATLDYEEDSDEDYRYHLMLTQERLKGSYLWRQETDDDSTINTEAQIDIPLCEVTSISFVHKQRMGKMASWLLGPGLAIYITRMFINPDFLSGYPLLPAYLIGMGIVWAIISGVWLGHSYYVSLKQSTGDELIIPVPKSCCDDVKDFIESVKEAKAKHEE